jgi:hypothetical protein
MIGYRSLLGIMLTLCLLTLMFGCGPGTEPGGSTFFGVFKKASVYAGGWGTGTAVVIWTDIEQGGSSGLSGSPGRREYSGGMGAMPDGRKVQWKCVTTDGKTGPVTINGIEHQLANGPLFLVTTRNGKTEVKQLQRDFSKMVADVESMNRLTLQDKDVSQFIEAADGK